MLTGTLTPSQSGISPLSAFKNTAPATVNKVEGIKQVAASFQPPATSASPLSRSAVDRATLLNTAELHVLMIDTFFPGLRQAIAQSPAQQAPSTARALAETPEAASSEENVDSPTSPIRALPDLGNGEISVEGAPTGDLPGSDATSHEATASIIAAARPRAASHIGISSRTIDTASQAGRARAASEGAAPSNVTSIGTEAPVESAETARESSLVQSWYNYFAGLFQSLKDWFFSLFS